MYTPSRQLTGSACEGKVLGFGVSASAVDELKEHNAARRSCCMAPGGREGEQVHVHCMVIYFAEHA